MATPFVGEIRTFGFNFAPRSWALCNGQILPISQNTALFSLLGTQYGGNGTTNFALPDIQGRAVLSQGQGPGLTDRSMGEMSGSENITLLTSGMPNHTHSLSALPDLGEESDPTGKALARAQGINAYTPTNTSGTSALAATSLSSFPGSNQPHNNMQPYLALNFCIALQGVFPARN